MMGFYDRLAELGYADYADYLQGTHWRHFRYEFYRQKDLVFCECCGNEDPRGIALHHKTYERLGREQFDDVLMLCEDCHDRVHSHAGEIGQATNTLLYDERLRRLTGLFRNYIAECKRRLP